MKFQALTKAEYTAFVDSADRIFLNQRYDYGELKQAGGTKVDYLGVKDDKGKVIGVALVLYFRYKKFFYLAQCVHGPVFDYENETLAKFFFAALAAYMRRQPKVLRLSLAPPAPLRFYQDILPISEPDMRLPKLLEHLGYQKLRQNWTQNPLAQPDILYTKDIEGLQEKDILKSVSAACKYEMNKAVKNGIQIRYLAPDEISLFKDMMNHTKERTGMTIQAYPSYIDDLPEYVPEATRFVLAYMDCDASLTQFASQISALEAEVASCNQLLEANPNSKKANNKKREAVENIAILQKRVRTTEELKTSHGNIVPMACSLFILSGQEAIYLLSGAYSEFAHFSPVYAIHQHMLTEAIRRGYRRYNFFAVSGDFTENAIDYGVLKFKQGFQGNIEEMIGTYEYVASPLAKLLRA
ncbi:MAG: peptidoglycan bridge formation glycyltransferase FemA/FemB family protein [Lachnospiraceae bacterium]|nr:peptidoglycan bridge formation glycyltransferase FemA/FemB family protein [Lachnospiraceae bacterium]MDY5742935.1 peptidoglycan bridge formation glycyltransferase FemA/FemB family protein [Lachnospiraceae bacterium]